MRRSVALVLALALLPVLAQAGAWPREKGRAFASVELSFERAVPGGDEEGAGFAAAYAEYGLTPRLTLGAKAGMSADRSTSEALVFARLPILGQRGTNRFAADAGTGVRWLEDGTMEPVLRSGLAWGRGFASRWGDGWMAVDGTWTRGALTGESWTNLDATLGLTPPSGSNFIVQLRGYSDADGTSVTFAPSYVRRVTDRLKAQIGATWRPGRGDDSGAAGVLAGLWTEF